MKVKGETGFKPITVTLETQAEVDTLFAIFNHSVVVNHTCFADDGNSYELLLPYTSYWNRKALWHDLNERILAHGKDRAS